MAAGVGQAQPPQHLETVHTGQLDVEQDQVGAFVQRHLQAEHRQRRADHLQAGHAAEHGFHQQHVDGVVFDIEHLAQPHRWQVRAEHRHRRRFATARHRGRLGAWQAQPEGAADTDLALEPDLAAHRFHQVLAQRQAQAGAFHAGAHRVEPLESLEQARRLLRAQTQAVVADADAHALRFGRAGDVHVALRPVVLDGVRHQVEQHLLQPRAVGHHKTRAADFALHVHVDAVGARQRVHQTHALLQQLGQLYRLERHLQLAGFDQRQVEHFVDQVQQVARAAQDLAHVLTLLLGQRVLGVGHQQLPETENRVHRGAQLVRHAREEFRLGAVRTLGLFFRAGQCQLSLEIRSHVSVGANQAAVGQVPRLHFDAPPRARFAHIEQRQLKVLHRTDGMVRLWRHVRQVFAEVATLVLEGGNLGERGAVPHQCFGQVEQFEHAPVVHADAAFGVHADDALRDAVERHLQGVCLLRQLGAGGAQPGFGALALAHVGEHADRTDVPPGGVEDRRGVIEAVELAAVGPRECDFVGRGHTRRALLHLCLKHQRVGGVDESVDVLADDVFARPAENAAHRRVHVGRDAFGVDEPEAFARGLHQQRQKMVLFSQRQLGGLGLGDVLHHAIDAHHLAIFSLRPTDQAHPAFAAAHGGKWVHLVVRRATAHHRGQPSAQRGLLLRPVQVDEAVESGATRGRRVVDQVGLRGETQCQRGEIELPAAHRRGGAGAFKQLFAAAQRLGLFCLSQSRSHVVALHLVRAPRCEAQERERADRGNTERPVDAVGLAEQLQGEQHQHRCGETERGRQVEGHDREAAGGHPGQHDDSHRLVQRIVSRNRQGAGQAPRDAVRHDAKPIEQQPTAVRRRVGRGAPEGQRRTGPQQPYRRDCAEPCHQHVRRNDIAHHHKEQRRSEQRPADRPRQAAEMSAHLLGAQCLGNGRALDLFCSHRGFAFHAGPCRGPPSSKADPISPAINEPPSTPSFTWVS